MSTYLQLARCAKASHIGQTPIVAIFAKAAIECRHRGIRSIAYAHPCIAQLSLEHRLRKIMPEGSGEGRTIEAPSIRVGTWQDSIIEGEVGVAG